MYRDIPERPEGIQGQVWDVFSSSSTDNKICSLLKLLRKRWQVMRLELDVYTETVNPKAQLIGHYWSENKLGMIQVKLNVGYNLVSFYYNLWLPVMVLLFP